MSNLSRLILERVFCFSKTKGKFTRDTTDLEDGKPIKIKDITVTPFTVDHSAYNAYMLLIEAEGKKILHTGDFRNHGYKGVLLPKTLKRIGKIDILITEGTTLSREQIKSQTEQGLVKDIVEATKDYSEILMLMSTTNIDRVTTMQKVANKTNKTVIHDILLSNILTLVTQRIPNALNSNNVYVFLPSYYYNKRNLDEYKPYITPFKKKISLTGQKLRERKLYNEHSCFYAKRYN